MTGARTIVPAATLGLAAAGAWIVAARMMDGMDMGAATELGSFHFFVAAWTAMMAAMMLPGAVPAASRWADAGRRSYATALFAASYLAIWTLAGLAVYALYRPHGALAAGAVTVAAGLYEVTPLKRECRRRCRASVGSGLELGIYCLGSSAGLMAMLLALGAMSVAWMVAVGLVVLGQKLLPPRAVVDRPVAIGIVALGIAAALRHAPL